MKNIAVVGEGVIGISTALAIRRAFPRAKLTMFSDRDFAETTSFGPAGIFRVDSDATKRWAADTFAFWAQTERENGPWETGIHLISGHLQCDDRAWLESQEHCMADIVFNWHWLSERELRTLFVKPSKFGVHYSAYAAEGRLFVGWMRRMLEAESGEGALLEWKREKIGSIQELLDSDDKPPFTIVVNCAGLNGARLAGDEDADAVYPNRGVALEVDVPGHKHFSYRGRDIFCIPMVSNGHQLVGTLREDNNWSREVTERDRAHIWARFTELQPNFKNGKIVGEWCGLRPNRRAGVRLEHKLAKRASKRSGPSPAADVHVIHNYGHASNGILLSWGCALGVVRLINKEEGNKSQL